MAESILGNSLDFLSKIGIFEVVLPFMLVFTIVFAILEKTRIFGTEKVYAHAKAGSQLVSRKSQNSMVAFVVAFFVVASSQLVATINQVMANMVLLLLLSISFLILVGSFHGQQDDAGLVLERRWKALFMGLMFIGIVAIFLDALGWLQSTFNFLERNWSNEWMMSVFLVVVTVVIMVYVTGGFKSSGDTNSSEED